MGFIQVPLVYFSVTLFRTLHQGVTFAGPDSPVDEGFVPPLLINLAAFTLVYIAFTAARSRLSLIEDELDEADALLDAELAGSGITEPTLGRSTDD